MKKIKTKFPPLGGKRVYDIIGIGIGPFNLGLAAIADSIPNLKSAFFDQSKEFNWHPGMMLDNARLQVPFLADLVTLIDPCNKFSYLKYIHTKQRIIPFGIHEQYYIRRKEYNDYCKWAIGQLKNLHFGCCCQSIEFIKSKKVYEILIKENTSSSTLKFYAKNIVLGVGNVPNILDCASKLKSENIFHSSDYLFAKEKFLQKRSITIIGSGQSAAEIFSDLIHDEKLMGSIESLNWFSRSERFYPMEHSKLTFEMTTPDYIEYFYKLTKQKKKEVLAKQHLLYKGINVSLLSEIYDQLYYLNLEYPEKKIEIKASSELKNVSVQENNKFILEFYHTEMEKDFSHETEDVILATGYKYNVQKFLQNVKELIRFDEDGLYEVQKNYSVDRNNSIFVQNAELHTHGFNAPDLGMGPYRNAIILNSILKKERFKIEKNNTFQSFGL